ncbi:uncharacterized protein LOC131928932 [Physella acuta]|uniref:uncharacterized protein LOC131928932 n=1 Tax=Physella acuta TaxID=109671 RepID=UPI0027DBCDA9|nr:uncharacterized protein LOC131928932 [Physella acuta]XP_059141091.1 uncharacterized protein LOC131928932 [Physella acuta]
MLLNALKFTLFVVLTELGNEVRSSEFIENRVVSQLDGYQPACRECIWWVHPDIFIFGSIFHPNVTYMRDKAHFFNFEYCPSHRSMRNKCATSIFAWLSICEIRDELIHHDCKLPVNWKDKNCHCQHSFPRRFFAHVPMELLKGEFGQELVVRLRYGPAIPRESTWDMKNTIKIQDIIAKGHIFMGQAVQGYSTSYAATGFADSVLVLVTTVMALVLPTCYRVVGE